MKTFLTSAAVIFLGVFAIGADANRPVATPPPVVRGAVYQSASGTKLCMLMDQEMAGGTELEIGEITFAPNTDSGDHVHGATETFPAGQTGGWLIAQGRVVLVLVLGLGPGFVVL